ncbi:MAG TPA: hypothetical protein VG407_07830 [Caulobacteraceae bacterium]|nr:hypothetical protein [Caulobacteraceae bacterium]
MRVFVPGLIAAVALAAAAPASSPFTGRWIADLKTQDASQMVDNYLVAGGRYDCKSCDPPRSYPADGKPYAVPGDREVTSESVTVLSPRSIRTRIVSPTRVRETTMIVATDDETAHYIAIDHRTDLKGVLRTEYIARRIAPAPKSANRVSGSWRGVRYVSVPEVLRTIELESDGRTLTYRVPSGAHFTAVIDGPPAPVETPQGVQGMTQVTRDGPRTLVDTRKIDAKLVMRRTFTVSQDGRSLDVATFDPDTGVTFRATSRKK